MVLMNVARRGLAAATLLLLAGACSHDWSAADGDDAVGAETGELPDGSRDEGFGEADASEDRTSEAADESGDGLDAGPEDAPVVECTSDAECADTDPCTSDACDPAVRRCRHVPLGDGTSCGPSSICCGASCVSSTDLYNCGACGNLCLGAAHADAACDGLSCTLACHAGYENCNGTAADGCEAELATDELNCGGCGAGCADAETCSGSDCLPSWTSTAASGQPSTRRHVRAVWTGTEMLVWGGHVGGPCFANGGRYLPATDHWGTMAAPPTEVTGCNGNAMVWTSSEMIVWGGGTGGGGGTTVASGARYDPVADDWTLVSTLADPAARQDMVGVWSGSEMILWGGSASRWGSILADGSRYDPTTDHWTAMTDVGAPAARWGALAVWTGSEVLVWGGWPTGSGSGLANGGRYDPAADRWTTMATAGAPTGRGHTAAVWTGTEMLVWGGAAVGSLGGGPTGPLGDGAAYDPELDRWRTLSNAGAPTARLQLTPVWTGDALIVWGGTADTSTPAFDTGALYDPATGGWTAMASSAPPGGHRAHAAVWTGSEMIVWGGATADLSGATVNLDTGLRYRPR